MAVLVMLQPDARAEARLSGALGTSHDVHVEPSWDQLEKALVSDHAEVCIIDADHGEDLVVRERIASILRRHPDVATVVSVHAEGATNLFGLGGLGVDGVIVPGSAASKVRSDVDAALARARARRTERTLQSRLPEPGPKAFAWAVEHAGDGASVERLAAALAMTPGGLREACQETNLPTPAKILLWGRLILAAARLHTDGRRVEEVAFSLGYSTATSLARAMKLHTGLTPVDVSRMGGLEAVLEAITSSREGGP